MLKNTHIGQQGKRQTYIQSSGLDMKLVENKGGLLSNVHVLESNPQVSSQSSPVP
jgi:hypothetical protein